MGVYVDDILNWGEKGDWCHMVADSLDELHEMARRIGLKRTWFQNHPRHPHYDLRPSKRRLAVKYGAVEVSGLELVKKVKQINELKKGKK